MSVKYEALTWVNGVATPLNADNLNRMEIGIKDTVASVNNIEKTVGEHTTTLSNKVDTVAFNTKVQEIEKSIQQLDADGGNNFTTLETAIKKEETARQKDVQTITATVASNKQDLDRKDTELETAINTNKKDIKDLSDRVTTTTSKHNDDITALDGRVDETESDIVQLKSTTSTATSDITGLRSDVDKVKLDIVTLNTQTGTAAENITTLQGTTSSLTGEVTAVKAQIASLDTKTNNTNSTIASETANRTAADTTLQNNIDTEVQARIVAVKAEEDARKKRDNELEQAIDSIKEIGVQSSVTWENVTERPEQFSPAPHTHSVDDVAQLRSALTGKSDTGHTHSAASTSISGFMTSSMFNKLEGISEGANKTTVTDNLTSTSATDALSANQGKVLDGKISTLNNGAMLKSTYDTNDDGVVDKAAEATHATSADTAAEATNATKFDGKTTSDFATASHTHDAYENQNAFSKVIVGNTTIEADTTTDTLTLEAGDNITLTPAPNSDKITISSAYTDTKNTAGATTTSSKIYLIGATTQGANPVTYSQNGNYIDTNGKLYSNYSEVITTSSQSVNIITSNYQEQLLFCVLTVSGTQLENGLHDVNDVDITEKPIISEFICHLIQDIGAEGSFVGVANCIVAGYNGTATVEADFNPNDYNEEPFVKIMSLMISTKEFGVCHYINCPISLSPKNWVIYSLS